MAHDPLQTLCWFVERGYSIAFRGIYGCSEFHVRAVRGDRVLVKEGRELSTVLQDLQREAERPRPT